MLKNYLKIAIRNLLKHKVFSSVNILGLVAGLTCSFLIIIYVLYETSYDSFNKNAENIYRLGRELTTPEGTVREPLSSAPAASALEKDLPGISSVVRFHNAGKSIVKYEDKQFYEDYVYYVDPSVFDIFTRRQTQAKPRCPLLRLPSRPVDRMRGVTLNCGDSLLCSPLPVFRERDRVRANWKAERHSTIPNDPHPNPLPEYRNIFHLRCNSFDCALSHAIDD